MEMEAQLEIAMKGFTDTARQSPEVAGSEGMDSRNLSAQKTAVQSHSEIASWEKLLDDGHVTAPKVRKPPPPITSWFGDLQSEESEESSSIGMESEHDKDSNWHEVQRKKENVTKEEAAEDQEEGKNGGSCHQTPAYGGGGSYLCGIWTLLYKWESKPTGGKNFLN